MNLTPKAPSQHECAKNGHCVHYIPGKGFLCCNCPVRAAGDPPAGIVFTVQKADALSRAGYHYSVEILERIAAQINSRPLGLPGQLNDAVDSRIKIRDVSHVVRPTARVEDGSLIVEIDVLNTPQGVILQAMLDVGLIAPALNGVGSVDAAGRVGDDYELTSINLIRLDG